MLKVPSLSEIRLIPQLIMSNTLGVHRDKAWKNQYDDDATLARVMEPSDWFYFQFPKERWTGPGMSELILTASKAQVGFPEMLFACFLPL